MSEALWFTNGVVAAVVLGMIYRYVRSKLPF
jgi:hypothetical protein